MDKYMTVSDLDAALILPGLKEGLKKTIKDLEILMLTKKRELTEDERSELPSTLMSLSREELRDNIDAWVSLRLHYEWLLKDFDYTHWI